MIMVELAEGVRLKMLYVCLVEHKVETFELVPLTSHLWQAISSSDFFTDCLSTVLKCFAARPQLTHTAPHLD